MSPSHRDRTDADLARAIMRGGGSAAETELVARFARRVVLFGMRHLRDETKAHDLAQDVMLAVLEKLRAGDVREPERIGSFVLGTARWMAHDVQRRARRRAEVEADVGADAATTVAPVEPVDVEVLERAMAELSERERAIVALTFQHDRSATEIADVFGLRAGHVRVIRHRAIARLAQLVRGGDR